MNNSKRQEVLTHCRYLLESYGEQHLQMAYAALLKITLDAVVGEASKPEEKNDTTQETKSNVVEHCNIGDDDCALPPILNLIGTESRVGDCAEGQGCQKAETAKRKRNPRHKNNVQQSKASNA